MPAIAAFVSENPSTKVICKSSEQLLRLDHGEAHIAVRAGSRPKDPDYVVQALKGVRFGLYAHADYFARFGRPESPAGFDKHRFIVREDTRNPTLFERWLTKHVRDDQIVLRVSYPRTGDQALLNGIGIGFMPECAAKAHPSLVPAVRSRSSWTIPLWLLTHVDLHRTRKVQSMLQKIKTLDERGWQSMPDRSARPLGRGAFRLVRVWLFVQSFQRCLMCFPKPPMVYFIAVSRSVLSE